jgi:hypothetical protein
VREGRGEGGEGEEKGEGGGKSLLHVLIEFRLGTLPWVHFLALKILYAEEEPGRGTEVKKKMRGQGTGRRRRERRERRERRDRREEREEGEWEREEGQKGGRVEVKKSSLRFSFLGQDSRH